MEKLKEYLLKRGEQLKKQIKETRDIYEGDCHHESFLCGQLQILRDVAWEMSLYDVHFKLVGSILKTDGHGDGDFD